MNTNRKSDESVVPSTSANKGAAEAPAELAEERGSAKRNAEQAALPRTLGRTKRKSRGLLGVREAARKDGTLKFTARAYRAKPSRRAWIAKPDGRQRPLGVASLEDKIVQQAVLLVLQSIYEQDFLGVSYGFRVRSWVS